MARVVVVGGGVAGAAAAARLAKLGHEVTVLERRDRIGGAVGVLERDGHRWDTGPTSTMLPAVIRDLFRKSGRPLERELDLVPVAPAREHRFADGTVLPLPSGSRADQLHAVDAALGPGAGQAWVEHVHGFAGAWDLLRRAWFERPFEPDRLDRATRDLLRRRLSLHRAAARAFRRDERLRLLATYHARLDGQDPRDVPAWLGLVDYVEQTFGTWTVPGGLGRLADVLADRLAQRRVAVHTGTTARDVLVRAGRAVAVDTDAGPVDADVVVCAVDPRGLPALAGYVRRTTPALPPVVCHVGLAGEVPALPHEVVLHGDPMLVVRTHRTGPAEPLAERSSWTVLARGRLAEDPLVALARHGLDVRAQVEVRVDRSPRDQVVDWGGSPYGVRWQGPASYGRRPATRTPVPGVLCAGVHAAAWPGLPFAALTSAGVAELVGKA